MDRSLLAPAVAFAAVTAYGSAVALRHDLPSEPLGHRFPPLPVPLSLSAGLSAGTAAPWPMPLATLLAAVSARPGGSAPGRVCAWVGAALISGTLVEPLTWGRRSHEAAALATVPLNLLVGAWLVAAGAGPRPDRLTRRSRRLAPPRSVRSRP
ncbi:hypothetical protein [Georgenia sp. AZ-5]|uniref:hypothetical protein n=1 Tax=Georgenia sp. AZ-5 TaxID=3367526 RepID=UPI0037549161